MPYDEHSDRDPRSRSAANSGDGTNTDDHGYNAYPDQSVILLDEWGNQMDTPDTVPWNPDADTTGVLPMHGAGMDPLIPKAHRLPAVNYNSFTNWESNGSNYGPVDVGFPINAIIISNWTPQWVKVGGEWVPPFGINGVIKLPSSTTQATIAWEAPPGVTQPASTSNAQMKAVFCEEPLHPEPFVLADTGGAGAATIVAGTFTPSDAAANPTTAVPAESFTMVWNSTELQWERAVTAEADAMGDTGLLANGNMLWNGTTWDRALGGKTSAGPATGFQNVLATITDSGGNQRVLNSVNAAGDGVTASNILAVGGDIFNGTTWDRMRGSNTGATGAVATTAAAPTAANMLSGSANVQATTTTTLVTVPTGRTWIGYVGVSCATTVSAGGAAATVSSQITTAVGTGTVTPAAGMYARVDCTLGAVGAALSPTSDTIAATGQRLVVQAAGGTALIQHIGTIINGTAPQASGWAVGELM
jgi:hypothetical protein